MEKNQREEEELTPKESVGHAQQREEELSLQNLQVKVEEVRNFGKGNSFLMTFPFFGLKNHQSFLHMTQSLHFRLIEDNQEIYSQKFIPPKKGTEVIFDII